MAKERWKKMPGSKVIFKSEVELKKVVRDQTPTGQAQRGQREGWGQHREVRGRAGGSRGRAGGSGGRAGDSRGRAGDSRGRAGGSTF